MEGIFFTETPNFLNNNLSVNLYNKTQNFHNFSSIKSQSFSGALCSPKILGLPSFRQLANFVAASVAVPFPGPGSPGPGSPAPTPVRRGQQPDALKIISYFKFQFHVEREIEHKEHRKGSII